MSLLECGWKPLAEREVISMEKKHQEVAELPLLLKVETAAKLLSLGRTKMYELIAAGDVPVIRLGRSVRVPTASLRQWVEDRSKQSISA